MENSIIKILYSKRFVGGALLFLFTTLIATQAMRAVGICLPWSDNLKSIVEIINKYGIPTLFTISSVLATFLFKKYLNKNKDSEVSSDFYSIYKPKSKKINVNDPTQRELTITAYAPTNFFKDKISQSFKEITDLYGNVPLWVRYSMSPMAVSSNLQSVKAKHKINVYGERAYVQKFLSTLKKDVLTEIESGHRDDFIVLSEDPKGWADITNSPYEVNDDNLLPEDLKKSVKEGKSFRNILNAVGVFAGVVSILFALSVLIRRNRNTSQITQEQALQTAVEQLTCLIGKKPELKKSELSRNGWSFLLSDYLVNVDRKGSITSIRRVV